MNWEIYFDGERWNYRLAQDKEETDFVGSVSEVYNYVIELDRKNGSQLFTQ
jgi:hypothetical protein